jgi:chemotaxis protein MotB
VRRRRRDEGLSGGTWLNTYADMVTLLLAFFVLLFAFSELDAGQFQSIVRALQRGLGIFQGGTAVIGHDAAVISPTDLSGRQLNDIYDRLAAHLEEHAFPGISLEMDERGVTIRFADQVFFDLGKADLKPEAIRILNNVAPILRDLPNPIRVEGHTDNWPIRTAEFASNWELSVRRATNVVRYLIEEQGFDPHKLSAVGYAEYRPLRPNDTAENRALNRRVDIVIMSIDLWDEEPN